MLPIVPHVRRTCCRCTCAACAPRLTYCPGRYENIRGRDNGSVMDSVREFGGVRAMENVTRPTMHLLLMVRDMACTWAFIHVNMDSPTCHHMWPCSSMYTPFSIAEWIDPPARGGGVVRALHLLQQGGACDRTCEHSAHACAHACRHVCIQWPAFKHAHMRHVCGAPA